LGFWVLGPGFMVQELQVHAEGPGFGGQGSGVGGQGLGIRVEGAVYGPGVRFYGLWFRV